MATSLFGMFTDLEDLKQKHEEMKTPKIHDSSENYIVDTFTIDDNLELSGRLPSPNWIFPLLMISQNSGAGGIPEKVSGSIQI